MILAAVDSGKSAVRIRITDGSDCAEGTGPGFIYSGDAEHDLRAMGASISAALAAAGRRNEPGNRHTAADIACLGLTGLPGDDRQLRDLTAFLQRQLAPRVLLADDGVLAHAGALGVPGTVASIGTGTIVTIIDSNGRHQTRDAWGPILGDRGSAYAIGAAGLRAAAKALDEAGPATSITGHLTDMFQESPPTLRSLQLFYRDPGHTATVAAFAQRVLNEAVNGDAVARRIEQDAAAEAAATITAAALSDAPISWTGRLLQQHDHYLKAIREACPPDVAERFTPPRGNGLDGGIHIAGQIRTNQGIYRAAIRDQKESNL